VPKSAFSPEYKRLLDFLVALRHESDLTQAQVAERLRKPQSFVSKYERGERRLDVIELFDVLAALGHDPEKAIRRIRGLVQ
jgi:transcriptional regulator with XRE-family HTH domain